MPVHTNCKIKSVWFCDTSSNRPVQLSEVKSILHTFIFLVVASTFSGCGTVSETESASHNQLTTQEHLEEWEAMTKVSDLREAETFPESPSIALVLKAVDPLHETPFRLAAVKQLKAAHDWQGLILVLPPFGDYGGVSIDAIYAVAELGNAQALPYLKRLDARAGPQPSGEFLAVLESAIAHLREIDEKNHGGNYDKIVLDFSLEVVTFPVISDEE